MPNPLLPGLQLQPLPYHDRLPVRDPASLAMVVNEIWNSPGPSVAGVGIILAGIPVYLFFARRAHGT